MAFKLTKQESKMKDEHAAALRADLEAVTKLAQAVSDDVDALNAAIAHYNETLASAKSFVEHKKDEWQGEFDDKSDTWQEGDRGDAASTFISEWEAFDVDDLTEVEFEMSDTDASHADDLDGLPSEMES